MKLTNDQIKEIKEQQSQKFQTKRVTSPELEKILYEALPVLDHGFVRVIDYMGDDSSIVQSARVSYGKGTKKVSTDEGLIKYLMRHWHSTPFEMCEIKYHVKLPIFIARQWIRLSALRNKKFNKFNKSVFQYHCVYEFNVKFILASSLAKPAFPSLIVVPSNLSFSIFS